MFLDFVYAIVAQSVPWLALNHLVYEVNALGTAVVRSVGDLYLPCKDLIPNFLPAFTNVGSTAHHKLVGYNSNREVVCTERMVLPTHNFRCHVAWCSGGFSRVFELPLPCHPKIGDSTIPIVFEDDVLWFDISVDDSVGMEVLQRLHDRLDDKLNLPLIEDDLAIEVIA